MMDSRAIGERSDAVLRAAMPGNDVSVKTWNAIKSAQKEKAPQGEAFPSAHMREITMLNGKTARAE